MKMDIKDRERREKTWNDILEASKEVTRLWKGGTAVEEIRVPEGKMRQRM